MAAAKKLRFSPEQKVIEVWPARGAVASTHRVV
jgi:hypothetical protein